VSLPGYSQKSSVKNNDCIVPCSTLRNALIVNEEKKLLEVRLNSVSDSLLIYKEIDQKQTQLINGQKKEIVLLKDNNKKYESIIEADKKIISEYKKEVKKQKTYKWIGYSTTIVSIFTILYLNI
jgi:hypothetical protein